MGTSLYRIFNFFPWLMSFLLRSISSFFCRMQNWHWGSRRSWRTTGSPSFGTSSIDQDDWGKNTMSCQCFPIPPGSFTWVKLFCADWLFDFECLWGCCFIRLKEMIGWWMGWDGIDSFLHPLIDRLIVWFIYWLIPWLFDLLIDWLADPVFADN